MTGLHFLDPNPSGNPTVLLFHGLGADGTSWALQLPALIEAGFRPVAPDVPGFGESAYDGKGWTIRRMAGQMADLLRELDAGPAHVVGLSMGGVIAQQFAFDFPELTQKLVLVSTFSVLRPENWNGWAYFMKRSAAILTLGLRAQAEMVAQRVFPDPDDLSLRELLVAAISQADPRAYRRAMVSLGLFDSRKRLGDIKIPTLVVTGLEDTTVPPARQRLLVEGIPAARQVVIREAGHAVPVDQPEEFNQTLIHFLKGWKYNMKFEFIDNLKIPKIGFGTWRMGGEGAPDHTQDEGTLAAMRSALDLGYTHFDTAEYYAGGHAEELLGRAIRASGLKRKELFITSKVSPEHLHYDDVLRSCEGSLRRMGMDYLDLYLIHWPSHNIALAETFRALNKLVADGKVRHLGVSNFNLTLLQEAVALSETKLLTEQVPYSLPERTYVKNGVLAYCEEHDILLTAYTPVKHRFIQGPKLKRLAKARGITARQYALAWLINQPRVITIVMSYNPQHQTENLAAADIVLPEGEDPFLQK